MKTVNCSDLMKLSIPSVRYALAHELTRKYGMEQSQVAASLGITQAAVNKYLSGKCSARISKLGRLILSKGIVSGGAMRAASSYETEELNKLIDSIASGKEMAGLIERSFGIRVQTASALHRDRVG